MKINLLIYLLLMLLPAAVVADEPLSTDQKLSRNVISGHLWQVFGRDAAQVYFKQGSERVIKSDKGLEAVADIMIVPLLPLEALTGRAALFVTEYLGVEALPDSVAEGFPVEHKDKAKPLLLSGTGRLIVKQTFGDDFLPGDRLVRESVRVAFKVHHDNRITVRYFEKEYSL